MTGNDTRRLITIAGYERAGTGGHGSPPWPVTDKDGKTWEAHPGGAGGPALGSPGLREGSHAELTLTPDGRVRAVHPVAFTRLAATEGGDHYTYRRLDGTVLRTLSFREAGDAARADTGSGTRIVLVDTRYGTDGGAIHGDTWKATLYEPGQPASAWTYTTDGRRLGHHNPGVISVQTQAAVSLAFSKIPVSYPAEEQ
jgi:hypothetical protein